MGEREGERERKFASVIEEIKKVEVGGGGKGRKSKLEVRNNVRKTQSGIYKK